MVVFPLADTLPRPSRLHGVGQNGIQNALGTLCIEKLNHDLTIPKIHHSDRPVTENAFEDGRFFRVWIYDGHLVPPSFPPAYHKLGESDSEALEAGSGRHLPNQDSWWF